MTQPSESRPVKWCKRCEANTERYASSFGRCVPCAVEDARRRREANPDVVRERNRRYHAANRERRLADSRRWREENPERMNGLKQRWREANRGKESERHRRYAEQNPEQTAERKRRYRARKLGALVHDVSDSVIWQLNPAGPGCCNYCLTPLELSERKSWHIDHVVPLSRGGLHELSNLVIACAPCNLSKGPKLLSEWRPCAA